MCELYLARDTRGGDTHGLAGIENQLYKEKRCKTQQQHCRSQEGATIRSSVETGALELFGWQARAMLNRSSLLC